jgi:hypothetical protein
MCSTNTKSLLYLIPVIQITFIDQIYPYSFVESIASDPEAFNCIIRLKFLQ